VIPEFLQIIILAIVQGIAEFLPISSSGHLVALSAWFGKQDSSAEITIVLHFGTLLAILVFYRQRIFDLLTSDRRVIPLLVAGTIPAAIIGVWLKQNHEQVLENPLLAGLMLPVTAFMLMGFTRIPPGNRNYTQLGLGAVLIIGLAQAFALLPGISRSGSTIVAGCLVGLKRQAAATFSFLLAIPAIAGASLFEARHIMEHGASTPVWLLVVGALISFAVGLLALRWLVRWIETGRLHYFAYWLLPVGFLVVIWQLYEILSKSVALP
jgi:undecaprenyl-diphosphatase